VRAQRPKRPKRLQLIKKIEEPKERVYTHIFKLKKKLNTIFRGIVNHAQTNNIKHYTLEKKMTTLESISTQLAAMNLKLETLLHEKASKPKASSKKPKDPDAPKKEANYFIKATTRVRAVLKPHIEEYNSSLGEGEKKLAGTAPITVSSMLKDAGLLSDTIEPSEEDIVEYFEKLKADPSIIGKKNAPLREAAKARKAASIASGASEASADSKKSKASKVELSDEEKAAERKARAAKAAATRAANKAKKEAEAAAAAAAEDSESESEAEAAPAPAAAAAAPAPAAEEAEATVTAYEWEGDIGKGTKKYERIDWDGKAWIYTLDSEYIGVWDEKTKKLNKKIKDFQLE
jgi:hypothetical protein